MDLVTARRALAFFVVFVCVWALFSLVRGGDLELGKGVAIGAFGALAGLIVRLIEQRAQRHD